MCRVSLLRIFQPGTRAVGSILTNIPRCFLLFSATTEHLWLDSVGFYELRNPHFSEIVSTTRNFSEICQHFRKGSSRASYVNLRVSRSVSGRFHRLVCGSVTLRNLLALLLIFPLFGSVVHRSLGLTKNTGCPGQEETCGEDKDSLAVCTQDTPDTTSPQ